jgi:Major Facilitator Superfamily/Cyclic nucleotide-binding domain
VKAVVRVVIAVMANSRLTRIMAAYAVFTATQNAVWIAMLVYAYARGGATTAGAVAVVQLVPAALVAPAAASLADRRSPSGVLTAGYLVQVVGMLAAAAGIALDAAPAAYAGAVVASVAVATTRPAQAVVVPALVRSAEELTGANALTGWLESVGVVASSFGTGVLLAVAGPGWVFAVAGVAGIGSVALAGSVRGVGTLGTSEEAEGLSAGLAGLRVLARQPAPRLLVVLLTAQWVVIGALDLLFVVLAVDVLGRGEGWVGYLNTAYGVGGVIAGLVGLMILGRSRLSAPILGGVAVASTALAATALSSAAPATLVLLAAVGGGRVLFAVATQSLLQRAVPADVVGRVFGAVEALAMAGLALGSLLVPLLVAAGGPVAAVLGAAAILPLVALAGGRALFALDGAANVPIVEIALLRSLQVFRILPIPALEGLARAAERVTLSTGDVLIREGEEGDRFYAVVDGGLDVTVHGAPAGRMTRGDGVGEIALLKRVPRTATVTAASATSVLALDREAFLAAVGGHTATGRTAASVADERLEADRRRAGAGSDGDPRKTAP